MFENDGSPFEYCIGMVLVGLGLCRKYFLASQYTLLGLIGCFLLTRDVFACKTSRAM